MTDPNIFKIENALLGLTLVDTAAVGYQDYWQAPGGKHVDQVTIADYAGSAAFSCQTTSVALPPSPQVTNETIPATGCSPAKQIPTVGETSYALAISLLQDLNISTGLSAYLYANDTKEAYWFFGMNSTSPPRAIGRCRITSGAIGGGMRALLTSDVSLPVTRKADVEFGVTGSSIVVPGSFPYRGAAKNGDVFLTEPTVTASDSTNAAKLAALGYVASPTTAWLTGHKITVNGFLFNWSGSAWAAGAHA